MTETPAHRLLLGWLLSTLALATLTLWIQAYWPVAVLEISIMLLAAVVLLGKPQVQARDLFPLGAFSFVVLWGCLQLLTGHTVNRFATERSLFQWMTWAALYYAALSILSHGGYTRRVRTWLLWFGCALSVEAILQAYLSPGIAYGLFPTGYEQYVMGPIVYHSHYAALVETILPLALYRALVRAEGALVYLGVSAILLASLVVSASRGGILLSCGEVLTVVMLLRFSKKTGGVPARLLMLAGATVIMAAIAGFETATERFRVEALMAGRVQFALSTLHMIEVHPLLGWGLGTWPSVYPAFATFDAGAVVNQAHTDWLQWTAEGGLPCGVAMLALVAWAAKPAIRSIWGVGLLAVFVHALFDYPFSRPAVGAWPVLLLAMVVAERTGVYSGLTVEDLPPASPTATPTAAPAASPTMMSTLAVSE